MATKKQLSHAMYTVGLITALPKELAAVRAVLDEEHSKPGDFERHPRDKNHYVWGTIGAHNVVIASLPSGVYGLVSAATTASQFLSSIPHIRFGLMVGIGAGIPRENFDIRLGDVIVSKPEGDSPGVVQYDLGKIQNDDHFHRVGSLASPPDFLLTALGKLESEHLLQDSQIPNILLEMLQRYPALANPKNNRIPYVYQGAHNDILFSASAAHVESPGNQAGIVHLDQRADNVPRKTWDFLHSVLAWAQWLIWFLVVSPLKIVGKTTPEFVPSPGTAGMHGMMQAEICASCDSSKEIKRQPRSSTEPVIHYGVIVSGNLVVKDGVSRDKILQRIHPKCVCFEMEAAGLMRTFPCVVIRGVCDYANTHENDRWQNYAAAAAAAYAKELLLQVDPVDVLQAPSIRQIMEELTDKVSVTASNTEETKRDIQDLKKIALKEKFENWICAFEVSTVHNTAKRLRHKDTGKWLFEHNDYLSWKRTSKSSLWLYGKPGSGKTIISSTIIEDLRTSEVSMSSPVLYFYFAFNDNRRQSLDDAIRLLIYQLYFQSGVARDMLDLIATKANTSRETNTDLLCETFKTVVQGSGGAWILLDALDECQTRADLSANQGLLSWIQGLINSDINIRFLITSRPEFDIKSTLGKIANYLIDLSGASIDRDIEVYVSDSMSKHHGLRRWFSEEYEDLREEIKHNLTANADGM
ncbi:hypothetical protein CGLO_04687 [Colletotrichum gloeosporioides Cg-14]|uniref:NACHT domain-containing protein n=1 Tax=Colletotrichum gloeosporioides (strain Cg-14) TaxID=1237896 RepID=T0KRU3_COLGC|nr:hypothetical protein CGLO_04687 [Colletotrichum gloeosporioides Cg-14]